MGFGKNISLFIVLIVFISCVGLVLSEKQTKFDDGTLEKNLSGTNGFSNWSDVVNISIPKNADILQSFLNVTGLLFTDVNFSTNEIEGVSVAPLGDDSFVIAWCDETSNDITFSINDINQSSIVGETDADTSITSCSLNQVSVSALNSSSFVIGWSDLDDGDATFSIYGIDGVLLSGPTDADTSSGTEGDSRSVSVSALNSTAFVFAWYDDGGSADDIEFGIYASNSDILVSPVTVDSDVGDGPEQVSVSSLNSSLFVVGWTQGTSAIASFRTYGIDGVAISTETDADVDIGFSRSASISAINSTAFVFAWLDADDDDVTFAIYDYLATNLVSATDIDTDVGTSSTTQVSVSPINESAFVVGYFDDADDDHTFAMYSGTGVQIIAPTDIDITSSTGSDWIAVASQQTAIGSGLSLNQTIIVWVKDSNEAYWTLINETGSKQGYYPMNVSIDVSNDGDAEFSQLGANLTTQNKTADLDSEITDFLSSCSPNIAGYCSLPINVSAIGGIVKLSAIDFNLTEVPRVNLTEPLNISYSATRTELNYTLADLNPQECWYSLNLGVDNVTIATCGNNVSGLNSGEGDFTWIVWANDTDGSVNQSNVSFSVALFPPVINLDYPDNNGLFSNGTDIFLNYTATDSNGISNCSVWHDINGSFSLNKTNTGVTSGEQNFTIYNATSDNTYSWNVQCTDTTNQATFNNSNFTFVLDTIPPNVSEIEVSTTEGSQTITFNFTTTDLRLDVCTYAVYNSSGGEEISNTTLTSCGENDTQVVVSNFATYTLEIYGNDTLNNLGQNSSQFITAEATGVTTGGGGGTVNLVSVIAIIEPQNFTILISKVDRAIIYIRAREQCAKFSKIGNCNLLEEEKRGLILILAEQKVELTIEELEMFLEEFNNEEIEEIQVLKSEADKYNLFKSTLEILELPFSVSPSRLDPLPTLIASKSPEIKHLVLSNKPLLSVEIIEGEIGISVEQVGVTTVEVVLRPVNLDFAAKTFTANINYISDEGESIFQEVNLRTINLRHPTTIIVSLIIVVLIVAIIMSTRKGKKSKLLRRIGLIR